MQKNTTKYFVDCNGVKRCRYREEGICTYDKSLEEQFDDEENGLPAYYCDGLEKDMIECGLLEEGDIQNG